MPDSLRIHLVRVVAARVLDLRAEFEAQLRAVARLEDQLQKSGSATDARWPNLEEVLRRELAEMLRNNSNIRAVLTDLASDVGTPVAGSSDVQPL